jgi:hypothetical protein
VSHPSIEKRQQIVAHMAVHGWWPAYGGLGSVGFWNDEQKTGVGVFFRNTIDDPDGERIGEVTTLGQKFKCPVDLWDMPDDILHKIAKYTKVLPLC